jgi:hypothetical protein
VSLAVSRFYLVSLLPRAASIQQSSKSSAHEWHRSSPADRGQLHAHIRHIRVDLSGRVKLWRYPRRASNRRKKMAAVLPAAQV